MPHYADASIARRRNVRALLAELDSADVTKANDLRRRLDALRAEYRAATSKRVRQAIKMQAAPLRQELAEVEEQLAIGRRALRRIAPAGAESR
jgi:hypothetical protein